MPRTENQEKASPKLPLADTDSDRYASARNALSAVARETEGISGALVQIVVQLAATGDVAWRCYYKDIDGYEGGVIAADDVAGK